MRQMYKKKVMSKLIHPKIICFLTKSPLIFSSIQATFYFTH